MGIGPFLDDRVRESSTSTGTGNFIVLGVAAGGGYRRFQDAVAIGNLFPYVIQNTSTAEWEVGIGTMLSTTTFSRNYVTASSNNGSLVAFSAGSKDVWIDVPAAFAQPTPVNYIVNDFSLWQRASALNVSGTLSALTISADSYGPDRWRCHRENADLQYSRQANTGQPTPRTPYYGRFTKVTNTGKVLICQPIENVRSSNLANWTVTWQPLLWSNASRTLKIAIVEWDGTADATTAAMVTAWNANGSDPTFAANYNVVASASCSVTTSAAIFAVTGTPTTSCTNLLAVIWSDSQLAATDYINVAEPALYLGAGPQPYSPKPYVQTVAECQRFCFTINNPSNASGRVALGYLQSNLFLEYMIPFPVAMRAEPTFTHNVSAWATANPTGTQTASFNAVTSAFTTITGGLTVAAFCPSPTQSGLRFSAATSFSGTNGDALDLRIGPSVIMAWTAEI